MSVFVKRYSMDGRMVSLHEVTAELPLGSNQASVPLPDSSHDLPDLMYRVDITDAAGGILHSRVIIANHSGGWDTVTFKLTGWYGYTDGEQPT